MLTALQYRILKRISPGEPGWSRTPACQGRSKLRAMLGDEFLRGIAGKTVIDFGCGEGLECVEMAREGAARVTGIDIREDILRRARENAARAGVDGRCRFVSSTADAAEVIVSIDAFEHFADPAAVLRVMDALLCPSGEVFASFGPTWYHPLGGHLFSVFPWAHLVFSEKALIRWRSDFKSDGATRFEEVAGGLNRMTIARFERLVRESPLRLVRLEAVPIRKLRLLHYRCTREFTTAVVRCRLRKREA